MVGFISVNDPAAASAAISAANVAPGDVTGQNMAAANAAALARYSQLIPGVDNGVLILAAVATALLLVVVANR